MPPVSGATPVALGAVRTFWFTPRLTRRARHADTDLKDHFRSAGEVTHADVLLDADGRSKGCGLVSFASDRNAARAMADLNQTTLKGRAIFVREDREAALPGLPAPANRAPGGEHRDSKQPAHHPPEPPPQNDVVHGLST